MSNGRDTDRTETALATLRRALEDSVVEVRREAALALGQLGDVDSAAALARALASDSEPVRRAAALALGRISTADARTALLAALRADISVWREAAVGLSRHHEPDVVDGLTELLANPDADEHSRRGAALALGALLASEPLSMETAVGATAFEDERGRLHVML
ncbi:MAG TPA: HEAT repeat domain-containing protein [Solirubrobacterales bacterium]|nr:HEAT repeat domain-containing protein [Solirubrobacterales bacterium]